MDFTTDLLDPTLLDESYEIGILVCFHESLTNAQAHFSTLSQNPRMANQFTKIMEKLHVIDYNLSIIDAVIDKKKTLIVMDYELPEFELKICFN